MKKSELKQIIKEELKNVLLEKKYNWADAEEDSNALEEILDDVKDKTYNSVKKVVSDAGKQIKSIIKTAAANANAPHKKEFEDLLFIAFEDELNSVTFLDAVHGNTL